MPALYSDWFLKRLEEGFVYVRNPMSLHVVSKIDLSKEAIDCVVFWTKDPSKILGKIEQLDAYVKNYYFQITINGYPREIEKNVPPLETAISAYSGISGN